MKRERSGNRNERQWINFFRGASQVRPQRHSHRNRQTVDEQMRLAIFRSGRVWDRADERPRGFRIRNKQGRAQIDARRHRDDPQRRSFPHRRTSYHQRANRLRRYDHYRHYHHHYHYQRCDCVTSCFDRYDPIVSLPTAYCSSRPEPIGHVREVETIAGSSASRSTKECRGLVRSSDKRRSLEF